MCSLANNDHQQMETTGERRPRGAPHSSAGTSLELQKRVLAR